MALKWKKLGARTWYGEEGSYRYTINLNLDNGRYEVVRGGIMCGDRWASAMCLQSAKDAAQIDATKREDAVLALPNYDPATFMKKRA